jgi:polysaccharide export outer membrane protein
MRRSLLRAVVALLPVACAGCATTRGDAGVSATPALEPRAAQWAAPPAVSLERPLEGDYRLAPKDQITIQIHGHDDLTRTARISEGGTVSLPLLREPLELANLTLSEAEAKVVASLKGRYLVNPRATITVGEYAGRQVSVMGAVQQPGAYALRGNASTLLVALAEARGLRENADRVAYVARARPRSGEPQPVIVDLDTLLRHGDVRYNVVVEAGDTVFVPEANVYYVSGEVEKRGAYTLRRGTTLSKALTEAGGPTKLAATGEIKIVRMLAGGDKREITGIDLKAVMSGDVGQDPPLEPHDMVVVPASGAKVAAYGVLDFLRGVISLGVAP